MLFFGICSYTIITDYFVFFFRPKVTVSGEKNARLICITDDNSIEEPIEDQNHCKTSADTKTIAKTSSETQTEVKAAHRKVCEVSYQ